MIRDEQSATVIPVQCAGQRAVKSALAAGFIMVTMDGPRSRRIGSSPNKVVEQYGNYPRPMNPLGFDSVWVSGPWQGRTVAH